MTYNYKGESIQQQLLVVDNLDFERSMLSYPLLYKTEDMLKIKFPYNDTIYKFTGEGIGVSYVLYTGKYRPDRKIVEDMRHREDLRNNYLQIVDIIETKGYVFILSLFKRQLYAIVYNKRTNDFLFSNHIGNLRRGGGIKNDFSKKGNFWPMKSVKDMERVAQLIYPYYAGLTDMDDESNQIIQIAHLKSSE